MLARRVCRMKDSLSIQVSLPELAAHHMDCNMDMSSFAQSRERILENLELDETSYHEILRKGQAAVRTALKGIPKDSAGVEEQILFR